MTQDDDSAVLPPTGASEPGPVNKRSWFLRHKILTGIGVFLLIVVVSQVFSTNTKTDKPPPPAAAVVVSPTPAPDEASTPSSKPEPTPTAANGAGVSVCQDATGDAKRDDLRSVTLKREADQLVVTWTMTKVDMGKETTGFFVNLASEDGNESGQLGLRYLKDEQMAYFIFDDSGQTNLGGKAPRTSTTIRGSFPMANLERYGLPIKWSAATTVDGNDVDACPNDSGNIKKPSVKRFAG